MARTPKPAGSKTNFGQPRKLADSRKPVGSRFYRKLIIIVVEGEKTERLYFDALALDFHIPTVKVRVIDSDGKTSPGQILEKAIAKREALIETGDWAEDQDELWCVFDTEDGSNEFGLKEAYARAEKEGVRLAVSNPSFEYWYLIHFKETDRVFQNSDALISELKHYIKGYEKNNEIYRKIKKKLPDAIRNAQLLRTRDELNWKLRKNPSTEVDALVKVIKTIFDQKVNSH